MGKRQVDGGGVRAEGVRRSGGGGDRGRGREDPKC